MSEEFTIQCPHCGTHYNDLQDVCPYCGRPQPAAAPELEEYFVEEPYVEEEPAEYPENSLSGDIAPESFPDDYADNNYLLPAEDDIFAIAGKDEQNFEQPDEFDAPQPFEEFYAEDEFDDYGDDEPGGFENDELFDEYGDDDFIPDDEDELDEFDEEPAPRRFKFRGVAAGCLGFLLCAALLYGGVGIMAVRSGLQERSQLAKSESYLHYEKGQQLLGEDSIELAIAEFERALKLNPKFPEARQALREAQKLSQLQPTPTSQTRSAAAVDIFGQADVQMTQENWAEAIQTLSQVRDLDPDYRPETVSEMLYTANLKMGLTLVNPEQIKEALNAFEAALSERPDDPDIAKEKAKATLYLQGLAALEDDKQNAVRALSKLYSDHEDYLDVETQLRTAYIEFGDELAAEDEWCLAESQYEKAEALRTNVNLQAKIKNSAAKCKGPDAPAAHPPRPTAGARATSPASGASVATLPNVKSTGAPTATTTAATADDDESPVVAGRGAILHSAFNPSEARWEILAAPVGGGQTETLATNAVMPSLSPNGDILLFHSELKSSEGLHAFNLNTGEDIRVTQFRNNILPRWSGLDNLQLVFVAQDQGTGRWQIFQGFADGKSDPIILGDGRTPDWSSDGKFIAFQGTDPLGNNPGIYVMPPGGGESSRLTKHESDRMPVFSPNGSQIAYMSTQDGNWNIYTVSAAGGTPKQITQNSGNAGLPAWSPDGSQIAFVSDMGGSWGIYVADVSGSSRTPAKITDWDGINRPDWLMAQIWWGR